MRRAHEQFRISLSHLVCLYGASTPQVAGSDTASIQLLRHFYELFAAGARFAHPMCATSSWLPPLVLQDVHLHIYTMSDAVWFKIA